MFCARKLILRMENNLSILILIFLPLLVSHACNSHSRGDNQSFKFYYSQSNGAKEGSYQVITGQNDEDIDMTVVGCTNLEKSSVAMIDADVKDDGECVLLFQERDCHGPNLKKPATDYDNASTMGEDINSFHLCSWKELSRSEIQPESFQVTSLHYGLFDKNNSLLAEFSEEDVEECKDLPESADKRLTSINTNGNCLHLFENRNCQGETIKLSSSSSSWSDFYLKNSGWENKTSSIKGCGLLFKGKITNFRPTSTIDDLKKDGNLHKIDMGHVSAFMNNETGPVWKSFDEQNCFNETFLFERIESLSSLDSVEVINNISLKMVMFPQLCLSVEESEPNCISLRDMKREVKKNLKNAYQFPSSQNRTTQHWMAEMSRNFSFKKEIELRPCTKVEVRPILIAKNISFNFELGVHLSGGNHGKRMTPNELRSNLPKGMNYSRDLDQFHIFTKVKGRILATLGVKSDVEVNILEDIIPGCRKLQKEETPPLTEISPTLEEGREYNAFKSGNDIPNDMSKTSFDQQGQNQGPFELGGDNTFLIIMIVGIIIICFLFLWLLALCLRKSPNYPKEFEIMTVGGYALTIEFICCPRCK